MRLRLRKGKFVECQSMSLPLVSDGVFQGKVTYLEPFEEVQVFRQNFFEAAIRVGV